MGHQHRLTAAISPAKARNFGIFSFRVQKKYPIRAIRLTVRPVYRFIPISVSPLGSFVRKFPVTLARYVEKNHMESIFPVPIY